MEFCPKCGAVLINKGKKNACARCNYVAKNKIELTTCEKIGEKTEIAVVKKNMQVSPIIKEKCSECGNDQAYFWTVQTRSGDEAETKFFKCTKCEHTWREYR